MPAKSTLWITPTAWSSGWVTRRQCSSNDRINSGKWALNGSLNWLRHNLKKHFRREERDSGNRNNRILLGIWIAHKLERITRYRLHVLYDILCVSERWGIFSADIAWSSSSMTRDDFKFVAESDTFGDKWQIIKVPSTYFQTNIRNERRRKGIDPEMPPLEERDVIKAKYMETKPAKPNWCRDGI